MQTAIYIDRLPCDAASRATVQCVVAYGGAGLPDSSSAQSGDINRPGRKPHEQCGVPQYFNYLERSPPYSVYPPYCIMRMYRGAFPHRYSRSILSTRTCSRGSNLFAQEESEKKHGDEPKIKCPRVVENSSPGGLKDGPTHADLMEVLEGLEEYEKKQVPVGVTPVVGWLATVGRTQTVTYYA